MQPQSPMLRATAATVCSLALALMTDVTTARADATGATELPAHHTSSAARGIDLTDVIRAYARHMNLPGIFIDPEVPHRRIAYVMNGFDDATGFEELLRSNGLASISVNGVLHVASPQTIALRYSEFNTVLPVGYGNATQFVPVLRTLTRDTVVFVPNDAEHTIYAFGSRDGITKARALLKNQRDSTKTQIIPLHFGLNASDVALEASTMLDDVSGRITAVPTQNAIAITGSADFLARAKDAVGLLDTLPAQVFYTASFIEITPQNDTTKRGIQLGPISAGRQAGGSGSGTGTLTGGVVPIGQISANLDALMSRGEARIFKRINITSTSGHLATSAYDNQVPIVVADVFGQPSVRTVNAGVGISILPTIGTDNVTSALTVSYTEIIGLANNGYPNVAERKSTNVVTTNQNQVIVISGLYSDEHLSERDSAPPFSYIPIFGGAFKHRTSSDVHNEVIIVVSPVIGNPDGSTTAPNALFPSISPDLQGRGIAPLTGPAQRETPRSTAPASKKP